MAHPTQPAGTVQGGTIDQSLAQAIAAAVGAAVTTSFNEITAKLNELESRIKQTSVNDDTNFEANVVGAYDMYDEQRRSNVSHARIAVYAEQALAHAVEASHALSMRSIDHFCATNPETSPRATKI